MKNISRFLVICILFISIFSCSRKTVPRTNTSIDNAEKAPSEPTPAAKIPKPKTPVPNVITVNDAAAKKTVDGRYYYDLNGKRYYRNNKDGKYYLFNKSMYNNPDFNPPAN